MPRLGTIPDAMPHITAGHGENLARCIKDIEEAQSLGAATIAPIGQILDRLEQEFKVTFTEQMRSQASGRRRQSLQ
jgi:hypothetical protein